MTAFRNLRLSIVLGAALLSGGAGANVFLTVTEALKLAFPEARHCTTKSESKFLTKDQMKRASDLAGTPITSALVVRYTAECAGAYFGRAYTDTSRVRTHPETLFIALDAKGDVDRVEVLSFDEPLEYKPKPAWYATFAHAQLNDELQVKHQIPFVTGASLTGQATVQATRRMLAIERVLAP